MNGQCSRRVVGGYGMHQCLLRNSTKILFKTGASGSRLLTVRRESQLYLTSFLYTVSHKKRPGIFLLSTKSIDKCK